MVEVEDQVVEDIVEKVDMEGVQVVLQDTQDAQEDHHLEVGIVEAQEDLRVEDIVADHLLSEDDHRVDIRADQVADHQEATVVDQVVEDIRVVALLLEVEAIVETLVVDHRVEVADTVDLREEVQVAAIRKIDHLVRAKDDIATIVIAMVDHLVVKHNKKRRKPLFIMLHL
jgi:hypothetical protein